MKRVALAVAAVAAVAVVAPQAGAATKPKAPPAPKPVTITQYFHGSSMVGNQDQTPVNGALMTMSTAKPTGSSAKEFGMVGYGRGPNTACAGNNLFPNWVGSASGTLVGKVTVTLWARSTPSTAKIQVFSDVTAQACAPDNPTPLAEATVTLPSSPTPTQVTVTMPVVGKGKVFGALDVQVQPGSVAAGLVGPQLSGISYDATTAMSSVTFTCVPKTGKKTC